MPLADEVLSQFEIVEDFTVKSNPKRPILIGHWLVPTGQIDDAEPGVRQPDVPINMDSAIVRSAVPDSLDHPAQKVRIGARIIKVQHSGYPAHTAACLAPLFVP